MRPSICLPFLTGLGMESMVRLLVRSGTHVCLCSSFGGDSRSSFRGGVSKFVRGLGPVTERWRGRGGWGDALRPSCGRLGDALPPMQNLFDFWPQSRRCGRLTRKRGVPLVPPGKHGEQFGPPSGVLSARGLHEGDAVGTCEGEGVRVARHLFGAGHLEHLRHVHGSLGHRVRLKIIKKN